MKNVKPASIAALGSVALMLCVVPSVRAEGLGGVSGWAPSPNVCGTANLIPIVIGNATNQSQTGSVTVPDELSANAQIFPSYQAAQFAQGCGRAEIQSSPGYTYNFTVLPNSSAVFWGVFGGVDVNAITSSHNIGFGGLASGTSGQSWYDLRLSLTATESFSALVPSYSGTGGTDPATNNQNGFNLVQCNTANGNVELTDVILTPYSQTTTSTSNIYSWGQPICAGWLPEGQMVNITSTPGSTGVVANAGQINGNTISFAGTANGPIPSVNPGINGAITGMSATYAGTGTQYDGTSTLVASLPNAALVQAANNAWSAINLPMPGTSGTISLTITTLLLVYPAGTLQPTVTTIASYSY